MAPGPLKGTLVPFVPLCPEASVAAADLRMVEDRRHAKNGPNPEEGWIVACVVIRGAVIHVHDIEHLPTRIRSSGPFDVHLNVVRIGERERLKKVYPLTATLVLVAPSTPLDIKTASLCQGFTFPTESSRTYHTVTY